MTWPEKLETNVCTALTMSKGTLMRQKTKRAPSLWPEWKSPSFGGSHSILPRPLSQRQPGLPCGRVELSEPKVFRVRLRPWRQDPHFPALRFDVLGFGWFFGVDRVSQPLHYWHLGMESSLLEEGQWGRNPPVHYMIFSNISGHYWADANSTSLSGCFHQKCLQILPNFPWGKIAFKHAHWTQTRIAPARYKWKVLSSAEKPFVYLWGRTDDSQHSLMEQPPWKTAVPQKAKNIYVIQQLHFWACTQNNLKLELKGYLYTHVHSTFVQTQRHEATQVSIDWWAEKQNEHVWSWHIIQPLKGSISWHRLQCAWILKTFC